MDVLLIVLLSIGVVVLVFVGLLVLVRLTSKSLHDFLFSPEWRTLEECVDEGHNEALTRAYLEVYYSKLNVLSVRLDDHVRTCKNCQKSIYLLTMLETADPETDNAPEIDLTQDLPEGTVIPYDYFEAKMFSQSTADYFEFRITHRTRKRRKIRYKFAFRLPEFGVVKPA